MKSKAVLTLSVMCVFILLFLSVRIYLTDPIVRLDLHGIIVTRLDESGYYGISIIHDRPDGVIREGYQDLVSLRNINYVFIQSNAITDEGIVLISKIPEIENLSLDSVKITCDGFLGVIKMPNLKYLRLRHVYLTDVKCISAFPDAEKLEYIEFNDCNLDEDALSSFACMNNLKTVIFNRTLISKEAIDSLKETRPDIKVVYFNKNTKK